MSKEALMSVGRRSHERGSKERKEREQAEKNAGSFAIIFQIISPFLAMVRAQEGDLFWGSPPFGKT